MKKTIFLLLLLAGCQTVQIKKRGYQVSDATAELASIGRSKSLYNLDNDFFVHALPALENKVRLVVHVLPLNKELYKIYSAKVEQTQGLTKIIYNDSLAVKPEYVTVSIMDLTAMATELNGQHNKEIFTYLKDTEESVMVTSVATVLPQEIVSKIKEADSYYLISGKDKKYTIALYKDGKKIDTIDLQSGVPFAYVLGRFCWSISDRKRWYIGEIVRDNKSCKGNTRAKIKAKEEKNLFKL